MSNHNLYREVYGPIAGKLPKLILDKNKGGEIITPYLIEGETYHWVGSYNTKNPNIAVKQGQSLGHLFVTNTRLIFWPDEAFKPNVAIHYSDIAQWKSSWLPMKSRAVNIVIGGEKLIFAAAKTAVRKAEALLPTK
jgi:hypothetical protein